MSPRLASERRGEGPRLVLVHGFTQTRSSWARIASQMSTDHEVVMVDAPNHGGSTGTTSSGLGEAARLVTEEGGPGCYVGYSMGGRICLRAALDHPEAVQSLVLASTSAGIDDRAERAERRRADATLADRIETHPDLRAWLAEWLAGPLFAHLGREEADLEARLGNTARGLATSLRTLGTGSMLPLWDRLAAIVVPTAVVVGERDAKFLAIGRRLASGIGANAVLRVVEGAGHSVPFEKPNEFLDLLRAVVTAPARS
jgi:2-succinyl-6-hydroxy-2,4-cyclohexadiene-1-carboxylate synthase